MISSHETRGNNVERKQIVFKYSCRFRKWRSCSRFKKDTCYRMYGHRIYLRIANFSFAGMRVRIESQRVRVH